jgi:ABC-type multidrug transport system fused ATPase/permease subunit
MLPPDLFTKLNKLFFHFGRFSKTTRLYEVDFTKPWYYVIGKEKYRLTWNFVFEATLSGFLTAVPVIIATSFDTLSRDLFVGAIVVWIVFYVLLLFRVSSVTRAEANIIYSINTRATQYFIATDPINHSTREMGKLIGRVKRSSDSYEGIIDFVLFNLAGLVTSIFVSSYLFFQYDALLGMIIGVCIVFFMIMGALSQYFSTKLVYPLWSKNDDRFNSVSIESIAQAPYIRSLFASPIQAKRLEKVGKSAASNRAYSWMVPVISGTLIRIIFVISIGLIGYYLLNQVERGIVEPIIAVSLIVSYSSIANSLSQFSRNFGRFVDAVNRANDLFVYIREYGKTTYPSV